MYRIRRSEKGIELFDGLNFYNRITISRTSWEIIKLLKKHGVKNAVLKMAELFHIDEKSAKEDMNTVLENLNKLNIKLEDIPYSVSNLKYAPRTVHFDITTKCNEKCIYCLASDRMENNIELSTKQIIKIINQLPELDTWLLCISGGEPFLRKDIFQILDNVEKQRLLTQVYTNGLILNKKYAEKIASYKYVFLQISLDSHIPEHHDYNRGVHGSYNKTLQNIRLLLEYGEIPEICMILTRTNYKDLDESADFFYKLGIRYVRIGPAHPYSGRGYKNRDKIQLTTKQWATIGKKIFKLNDKYHGSLTFLPTREFIVYSTKYNSTEKISRCGNSRQVLYIGSNGLVYPCIFLAEKKFILGDGKKEKISEIWKNSYLSKKIRFLTTDDIEKCKTCEFKHLCSGGCRASAYYHYGSIFAHDPLYCALFNKST